MAVCGDLVAGRGDLTAGRDRGDLLADFEARLLPPHDLVERRWTRSLVASPLVRPLAMDEDVLSLSVIFMEVAPTGSLCLPFFLLTLLPLPLSLLALLPYLPADEVLLRL